MSQIEYLFRDDTFLTIKNAKVADSQEIGETLARISDANDGELEPQAVVDSARSRRSSLHKHFDWDDEVAAEKHRLGQARTLIRCVMVVDKDSKSGLARAHASISGKGGVSYRQHREYKSSFDLQIIILKAMERDARAFEERYSDFVDICDLVRAARQKASARRRKLERQKERESENHPQA